MKKALAFILLLTVPALAEGPLFHFKDPATQQEFENVYQDLRSTSNRYIQNTNSLQSGATFYVSSGTVSGQFIANGWKFNSSGRATSTTSDNNGNLLLDSATSATRGSGIIFQSTGTVPVGFIGSSGVWKGSTASDFAVAAQNGKKFDIYYNGGATVGLEVDTNGKTLFKDGTTSSPSICFLSDTSTGFSRLDTGTIAISASSFRVMDIDPTFIRFLQDAIPNDDGATQSLGHSGARWKAVWAANGTIQTSVSKEKRDMREIVSGSTVTATLVDRSSDTYRVPRGIIFKWKSHQGKADDKDIIGFDGDDLPQEAHAINSDGSRDPDNFYTSSVVGLLCSKVRDQDRMINDLQVRLAALEKKTQ